MPKVVKVGTGSRFEDHASYSRIVAVDDWIFVSNTAGRDPATGEIPAEIEPQTRQVFANVERALAAIGASLADVVASRVFVQEPADMHAVMTIVGEKFRGIRPALTATCPPLGSTVYRVEIEVTAHRGVGAAKAELITVSL